MILRDKILLQILILDVFCLHSFAFNSCITELYRDSGTVYYIYHVSGSVSAFPTKYLANYNLNSSVITLESLDGNVYEFAKDSVCEISTCPPLDLPSITGFIFDNKYNDMLMVDAIGKIEDNTITVSVGSIGKRLVPSISTDDDTNVEIYVDKEQQFNHVTSHRYEKPTMYTITRSNYRMLTSMSDGSFELCPFGNNYTVFVDYLCDHPTTEYGLPEIHIKTNDGTMISSKDYYWDATIRIDGAGYFPDMVETSMQIKGRGNTSWKGYSSKLDPKNPYRIKFPQKQKPLGMTGGKNWCLIANSIPGSKTANAIASRAAQMMECIAANHFIPVELYINGDYRGQYNLTEKVGFAANSVNVEDETKAVLLELDMYYDEVYKFRTDSYDIPVNIKSPNYDEDETCLTFEDVKMSFSNIVDAVHDGRGILNRIDAQSLSRYLAFNEFIYNFEITGPKSTYCYNPDITNPKSLYVFGPAWDFDYAMGKNDDKYYSKYATSTFWYNTDQNVNRKFIYDLRYNSGDRFCRQYYKVWTDFVHNRLPDLIEYCDDYYCVASKSFVHDAERWNLDEETYDIITSRSKTWLQQRADYVYDYISNKLGYAKMDYLCYPIIGDVDKDGSITQSDVSGLLRFLLNSNCEGLDETAADMNEDGLITTEDVVLLIDRISSGNNLVDKR